jgi:hypothetical protein
VHVAARLGSGLEDGHVVGAVEGVSRDEPGDAGAYDRDPHAAAPVAGRCIGGYSHLPGRLDHVCARLHACATG